MSKQRIGIGSDLHRLEEGRRLVIGGIDVPSDLGAVGHSDADALLHAITDAILGALALGDIGSHFRDTDQRWKGSDSTDFLREAVKLMKGKGYALENIDSNVHLERPKLRPFIESMRRIIAEILEVKTGQVSIKAKTGEGLDAVGERRAIKAEACILLKKL